MQVVDSNSFINLDIANRRLQEAMLERDIIGYLNKEYGYSIDKEGELASQIMNFIEDVRNLPAKYFETKFNRPVMLDEFAIAIVPEKTSAEVVDALKNAGLDVRTYDGTDEDREKVAMEAVSGRDDVMFSLGRGKEDEGVEQINRKFNEELQQQIEGTLQKGHIYQLGVPSAILRSTGFPNAPIELSSTHLLDKSKNKNHPFALEDVKNLVEALQEPIAVFKYGDSTKAQNVIIEIQKDGKNFLIGIHFDQQRHGNIISDIRGIFPKDNAGWLNWISEGKLLYADKEKNQILIDQQRTNLAEVDYLDLDSVAKLVKEFVNPTINEEKVLEGSKKTQDNFSFAPTTKEENEESYTRFSLVDDKDEIERLDKEPNVKVYRAMQLVDGKLYPPMAGKVDGKWQSPIELGRWEKSDEHPELVNEEGKFKLDKGNGDYIWAAYNPYLHTSRSPLNDQFSSAWKRPELVTVEVEVPESELTSGYKADKAKDAVGEVEWKSGPVSGKLAKMGNPRKVILSRYDKPIRIVPNEEVAQRIAEMLQGTGST